MDHNISTEDYYSNKSQTNGSLTEESPTEDNFELKLSIIIGVIYSFTFIVGLIGNSLVVLTIVFHKRMRNSTNLLILNLAIADLIFIIICVPFNGLNSILKIWYFGDFWCKIVHYTSNVTACTSIMLLVFMSIDRYLAIAKPHSAVTFRNQKNTMIVIFILWFITATSNIYHAFLWKNHQYKSPFDNSIRSVCVLKYYAVKYSSVNQTLIDNVELKIRLHYLGSFIFLYLLPLVSIFIIYGLIIYKLSLNKGKQVCKSKRRVTCMVIAVISCFIICWTPMQIMLLVQHVFVKKLHENEIVVLILSSGLSYLNSCLNPIIYGFSNNEFKKAYASIVGCQYDNKFDYAGITLVPKREDLIMNGQQNKIPNNLNLIETKKDLETNISLLNKN